jgi:hypothetical protein
MIAGIPNLYVAIRIGITRKINMIEGDPSKAKDTLLRPNSNRSILKTMHKFQFIETLETPLRPAKALHFGCAKRFRPPIRTQSSRLLMSH